MIGEPKTTQGRRPIALDKGTVVVLREHRRRMLEERMQIGPTSTTKASSSTSPMAAGYTLTQ
jgi:hypothetical protein